MPRVEFLSEEHPSFASHVSRLRKDLFIPVLVGCKLPKSSDDPEERETLSRLLLILFKPWRTLQDLRSNNETWCEAYDRHTFSPEARRIISNIHVEHECRDARDNVEIARR
ncbi:hypothetical protein BV25DRAFT_1811253, partial [Artomyces pyxidatus]